MIKAKFFPWLIVLILLVSMTFLMISSVKNDSATTDEIIHITSGYLSLKEGDFRFNPEHPFLSKQLIALSLLWQDIKLDHNEDYFKVAVDFYYDSWQETRSMAENFLYKMDNEADKILFSSRMVSIAFTILFALILFIFVRRLYGLIAAIFTLFLFAFAPNLIAHARLVNTDLWITLFYFLSVISFAWWLESLHLRGERNPTPRRWVGSWKRLILAAICFGLAQAVKFSAIILLPVLFSLWLMKYFLNRVKDKFSYFRKGIIAVIVMLLIAWFIIWASYGFSTFTPAEYQLLNSKDFYHQSLIDLEPLVQVFKPVEYLKGLVFVMDSTFGARPAYLLGQFQYGGWWYYFPIAFLVKTPLPIVILIILSAIFFIKWKKKLGFWEWVIILSTSVYFIISLFSKLNIGIRHLLPIYPFIFIWLGYFLFLWLKYLQKSAAAKKCIYFIIISGLIFWYIAGTVKIYPHYLSYFSDLIGGSKNGISYLADSNIDWGQDLKRLKKWLDDNQIQEPVLLEYFWTGEDGPTYYGINWQRLEPNNPDQKGYIAIGVGALQTEKFSWLKKFQPIAQVGYSINIYKID